MQASAQSVVREVIVAVVAQAVRETTATVVVTAMIAASAPHAQNVRLEPNAHLVKIYHR